MLATSPLQPRHRRRARARAVASLAVLLAGLASVSVGAPLRAPRPAPAPLAPLSASAAAPPIEHACGTNLDALATTLHAMAERAATSATVPLPTPHSTDIGEIAVLEDDGTFFFTDKGGNVNLDVAAAARAFYRTHGDDYDQIAFWLTSGLTHWLGSPTALAAAWPVRNDVSGIGLSFYDWNASLGLPPRVQTLLTMNGLHKYPNDPAQDVPGLPNYVTQDVLAHEFGHQWLAYPMVQASSVTALLGRAHQHWSFFFDADGSVMEGPDWVPAGPDTFYSLPPIARFGVVDQYLMGVRAPALVDSFFVLSDTATFWPPGPYVPISDPNTTLTVRGPSERLGIEDVVAANGPRLPAAPPAPPIVRMATILIVPRGSDASPADLAKLEGIRAGFAATVSQYTAGRMLLDPSLDSRAGRLVLTHTRLPDTETTMTPRPIGVRVTVEQAGIPIGMDPGSVTLRWRTDSGAPWSTIPMNPVAADSFTAVLPGVPAGTLIEYVFRAASDSPGIETELPDLNLSPPFATRVGPDVTPPVVTHWAQHAQAQARLAQPLLARVTDNLGLQAVWCELSLNGAPLQVMPATSAGGDSFVVSVGAGAPSGSKIAYRFRARDASAAQNLGYSNELFDTLRVGLDHVDGFWNPSPWTHANIRFNRRDEWHRVELAAAPAGSGAWHCGLDSLPHGPYQDAGLTSGLVSGIVPGCSLTFSHRFGLEEYDADLAFDGARVEVQVGGGEFVAATPVGGYSHAMAGSDQGLPEGAPCWSGAQPTWRVERFDLSPFAPGPIRVRFRMSSDLYVGSGGWWVDDVRVHFPGQATTDAGDGARASVRLGPLWPNPASGALRQGLELSRRAEVDWALYDVAGRRVETLWRGALAGGSHELVARPAGRLAGGLYFSRVVVDGRALAARRVALLR